MKWISIEDKAPKENEIVLTYFEFSGVEIAKYNDVSEVDGGIFGKNQFSNKSGFLTDDVKHWMPLPEPPKQ